MNAAKTLSGGSATGRTPSTRCDGGILGDFYAGLYHDALHDAERARAHLALAVDNVAVEDQDFTATIVPRLHASVRGWSLDDVSDEAKRAAAAFDLGSQGMEDILDDPAIMKEGIDAMTVAMPKDALRRGAEADGPEGGFESETAGGRPRTLEPVLSVSSRPPRAALCVAVVACLVARTAARGCTRGEPPRLPSRALARRQSPGRIYCSCRRRREILVAMVRSLREERDAADAGNGDPT